MSCRTRRPIRGRQRRAVVVVQVAVMGTVLLTFAALTIDVSMMYNAKGQLQRTADAAALAAASRLSAFDEGDPITLAREAAVTYTTANSVLGRQLTISENDVTFGRAVYSSSTGVYDFTPTEINPDAVRVRVRHTADSPNDALPLYFAAVFGRHATNMSAEAVAMLVPRDIAVVADLSGSHTDDSELRNYKDTTINLHEVWDDVPGGIDDVVNPLWEGDEFPGNESQMAGPAWGLFKVLGYGSESIDASYDPTTDPGLIELRKYRNWNSALLEDFLANQGYTPDEINAIMSKTYDSNGAWDERVAAALGLARWDSGMPGGLWEQLGIDPSDAGNGNTWVGSRELTWVEAFGDRSLSESRNIWRNYINRYMNRTWTAMYRANSAFRYRFGVKTFINYLLERQPNHADTPELADTHEQPMQAVKDAVTHLTATIADLDSEDQMSLEIYGTTARHEMDLTMDHEAVSNRLNAMQAGHYDSWTNMGGGILRAIEELNSGRANPIARQVMFLLTDGYANVPCEDCPGGDYEGGKEYALAMAQQAASQGIQIFAVSVGSNSDQQLMRQIASLGGGEHLHAEGSIDQYSDQLDAIFQHLGGRRPVELIR